MKNKYPPSTQCLWLTITQPLLFIHLFFQKGLHTLSHLLSSQSISPPGIRHSPLLYSKTTLPMDIFLPWLSWPLCCPCWVLPPLLDFSISLTLCSLPNCPLHAGVTCVPSLPSLLLTVLLAPLSSSMSWLLAVPFCWDSYIWSLTHAWTLNTRFRFPAAYCLCHGLSNPACH